MSGFKLLFEIISFVLAPRNQTDRAMVVVRSGRTAGERRGGANLVPQSGKTTTMSE
jgi:hypothetical protein